MLSLLAVCALSIGSSSSAAAQRRSDDYVTRSAPEPPRPSIRFAPRQTAPRFDVRNVDADTLVVSRPRAHGDRARSGIEGFVLDVPSLLASLETSVISDRGLSGLVELSPPPTERTRATADDSARSFVYPYRFSPPFAALTTQLRLEALDDAREARWIVVLAVALGLCVLAGLYALYRTVATQVYFAERRSNFVSAVSHELKTPLTAIRMYGELLRDGLVDGDKTRQAYYGLITAESERLSRLVENVLRLAQLERRDSPPPRSPARALPSIAASLELLRPRAEGLGFTLCVEIEPNLPLVELDPDGLTQVLFNLVDNALKYARDATDKRIDVSCVAHQGGVQLSVRDRGPGVDPDELARLGEAFYRAGSELTRRHEGVGLGLALVARIVEDMHGHVTWRNAQPGLLVSVQLRGPSR